LLADTQVTFVDANPEVAEKAAADLKAEERRDSFCRQPW
jgi:hypothetical protein